MMKNILILFAAMLLAFTAKAQSKWKAVSNRMFYLNTLGVGYAGEQSLGGAFTLIGRAGISTHPSWSGSGGWGSVNPMIGIDGRYYYNLSKRHENGQNTVRNTANYWAFSCAYLFETLEITTHMDEGSKVLLSPHWGMRRVYRKILLLEFDAGVNCYIRSRSGVDLFPRANLRFGLIF